MLPASAAHFSVCDTEDLTKEYRTIIRDEAFVYFDT